VTDRADRRRDRGGKEATSEEEAAEAEELRLVARQPIDLWQLDLWPLSGAWLRGRGRVWSFEDFVVNRKGQSNSHSTDTDKIASSDGFVLGRDGVSRRSKSG
jgi:hypothetical protein